jgi:ribosomal protein S27AE
MKTTARKKDGTKEPTKTLSKDTPKCPRCFGPIRMMTVKEQMGKIRELHQAHNLFTKESEKTQRLMALCLIPIRYGAKPRYVCEKCGELDFYSVFAHNVFQIQPMPKGTQVLYWKEPKTKKKHRKG